MKRADDDQAPSIRKKRINIGLLFILLLPLAYASLAFYSGSFLPLRLIKGASMEPTLVAGDVILLKKMPFDQLKEGDVIAYETPDFAKVTLGAPNAILHRVIGSESNDDGRILKTKGDNSDVDPWTVTESAYQGTQIVRVPYIGKPAVLLTSRRGLIFLAIGTLLTLLYSPAMMMFHMTVLKPPGDVGALATRDEKTQLPPNSVQQIEATIDNITSEQQYVRTSLLKLSESISFYATNLESHTEVVQNLANVTNMLKVVVEAQGGVSGRRAFMFGIMIVDDQESFRKRTRDVVEMEGDFRVVAEAGDGREALNLVEQHNPDLVVMDVQMPEMNGFEATRLIHERNPNVNVALVSMHGEEQYTRMAEEVGAMAFIPKKDLSAETLRQLILKKYSGESSGDSSVSST